MWCQHKQWTSINGVHIEASPWGLPHEALHWKPDWSRCAWTKPHRIHLGPISTKKICRFGLLQSIEYVKDIITMKWKAPCKTTPKTHWLWTPQSIYKKRTNTVIYATTEKNNRFIISEWKGYLNYSYSFFFFFDSCKNFIAPKRRKNNKQFYASLMKEKNNTGYIN